MNILYVESPSGCGKTSLSYALSHELEQLGYQVAVIKPLKGVSDRQTADSDSASDFMKSQSTVDESFELPRRGLTQSVLESVIRLCNSLSEGRDVVIVEGTSELSDTGTKRLVDSLDAKVLVLKEHSIDLTKDALADLTRKYGARLVGVVVNKVSRYQKYRASQKHLGSIGVPLLGSIPEDRTMLGISVAQVVAHLEGRYLIGEEFGNRLVEHFMVGGMGLDPAETYFRTLERKAVIVRGDRPDLQMSALKTSTSCMILTGDLEPIEYVKNESELEEVPLVVVKPDTITTMSELETMMIEAQFDHPDKGQRFIELVKQHLATDALYNALGLTT